MVRRARIAVIGSGWWATDSHIPGLLANPDAELVALCDMDPKRLQIAAEAFGIRQTFTSVESLLHGTELDGVIVATNHASHYAVARPCVEAGLYTLIEKPMTLFAAKAQELVDIARARGCEISLGYNHNYSPYAQRARTLIGQGQLGRVEYIGGVFNQHVLSLYQGRATNVGKVLGPGDVYSDPSRSGGGHGHLQMTHLLGLICFITGLRARTVQARMNNLGLDVDVVNALLIEFESGALATVGGTGNIPKGHKIDLQIYCSDGWIDIDESKGTAIIAGESLPREEFEPAENRRLDRRYETTNNLVSMVLGQATNGSPGEIGVRVVEILDAAYRSAARSGQAVHIEELYG